MDEQKSKKVFEQILNDKLLLVQNWINKVTKEDHNENGRYNNGNKINK